MKKIKLLRKEIFCLKKLYLLICLATTIACFNACSKSNTQTINLGTTGSVNSGSSKAQAITEVIQVLPEDLETTWGNLVTALNNRKIGIETGEKDASQITTLLITKWVSVTDKLCSLHASNNAPLSCRVQLTFNLQPNNPSGSFIKASYIQKCNEQEQMNLVCPNSQGEKLLIGLIEDLKNSREY